jgi:hypothetical protein
MFPFHKKAAAFHFNIFISYAQNADNYFVDNYFMFIYKNAIIRGNSIHKLWTKSLLLWIILKEDFFLFPFPNHAPFPAEKMFFQKRNML